MNNKTDTLNAGREFTITLEDGATEEIKVRQIPVKDYPRGFALAHDEAALVGFLTSDLRPPTSAFHTKQWAESLTPESYERILAIGNEVNALGFFAFCGRQQAAAQTRLESQLAAMAQLPPEALKVAMEQGQRPPASRSPISSPAFP